MYVCAHTHTYMIHTWLYECVHVVPVPYVEYTYTLVRVQITVVRCTLYVVLVRTNVLHVCTHVTHE